MLGSHLLTLSMVECQRLIKDSAFIFYISFCFSCESSSTTQNFKNCNSIGSCKHWLRISSTWIWKFSFASLDTCIIGCDSILRVGILWANFKSFFHWFWLFHDNRYAWWWWSWTKWFSFFFCNVNTYLLIFKQIKITKFTVPKTW